MRIGVTGHRHLAGDPDDLTARVRAELAIAADPLVVVTSLAEGADRVVAEVGLALGATLDVVLPMPAAAFVDDFSGEASRAQFVRLLDAAEHVEVVEALAPDDRDGAYEAAGRRVVERCDRLLALWDGGPARGRGGTVDAIDHARSRGVPVTVIAVTRAP